MWQRFNEEARQAITHAEAAAHKWRQSSVGSEFLLLGLLEEDTVARRALERAGTTFPQVRERVESGLARGDAELFAILTLSEDAKRAARLAFREADSLGDNYYGTEHLLLGLMAEGENAASHILKDLGLAIEQIREQVLEIQVGPPPPKPRFGTDVLPRTDPLLLAIRQNAATPSLVLLLAITDGLGVARALCRSLGVHIYNLQSDLASELLSRSRPPSPVGLDQILQAASTSADVHAGPMDSGDLIFALRDLGALERLGGIEIGRIRDTLRRIREVKEDREQ